MHVKTSLTKLSVHNVLHKDSTSIRYDTMILRALNKKLSCHRETARASCHWIFRWVTQGHSKWYP